MAANKNTLPEDRAPTLKELSQVKYKLQAIFFANGWWDDMKPIMETLWKTTNKFVELDNQQTPPRGENGNELDQFWSAKLIEEMEEEAMTATQRKEALKKIDLDSNGKMSLAEYLMWKHKKDPEATRKSPQGQGNEKMREAQAKMDEIAAKIEEITPKLEAAKQAAAAAAKAQEKAEKEEQAAKEVEAHCKKLEAPLKKAEEELAASVAELHAQEEAYHGQIAKLEKTARDETLGVVKRNGARNQCEQLKAEDPLPLRKAKISQGAALKKAEKLRAPFKEETEKAVAARERAEAAAADAAAAKADADATQEALEQAYSELEALMEEARAELEEAKKQGGTPWGAVWWMEREMFEADKRLPRSKQKYNHDKPFQFNQG